MKEAKRFSVEPVYLDEKVERIPSVNDSLFCVLSVTEYSSGVLCKIFSSVIDDGSVVVVVVAGTGDSGVANSLLVVSGVCGVSLPSCVMSFVKSWCSKAVEWIVCNKGSESVVVCVLPPSSVLLGSESELSPGLVRSDRAPVVDAFVELSLLSAGRSVGLPCETNSFASSIASLCC